MNVYYENTIDTIDDALHSGRLFGVASDTVMKPLVLSDPRDKVQQLAKRVYYYKYGTGTPEENRHNAKG